MTIHDHSDNSGCNASNLGGDGILLVAGGQIIAGEGYIPKTRKHYTITKQREKWTEEEHDKFLDALHQYGRAWRKIEGHVGTKSAVQIRSHAQKFFSKVVREAHDCNSTSVKPIEIPPPRPKRKPMHPYPRKVISPTKKDVHVHVQDQSARSMSPHSSADQEHQSPTSVLQLNEPVSVKLELYSKVHDAFIKTGSNDATLSKGLKLFGKTVVPEKCKTKENTSDPIAGWKRASLEKFATAFVPCKRSLSDRGTRSTCEEDETLTTRLCL